MHSSHFYILKKIFVLNKLLKIVLCITVISSFVTLTLNIDAKNFIIARMTFSDIFGLISLSLLGILLIKDTTQIAVVIKSLKYPLWLVFGLACSIFLSLNAKSTLVEVLIVLYLVLLSASIIYAFKNSLISMLFPLIIYTTFITSFIGLYDLVARNVNLPVIFNMASKEVGISGFRYFGQAANYIFTMLTILIPLRYSNYYKILEKWPRKFLSITILLGVIFLCTTGRISIIISFVIGIVLFILLNPNKKGVTLAITSLGLLGIFWVVITLYMPRLKQRIKYRVESRVTNRVQGTSESDFVIDNFKGAINAFSENPITGSGLGAFVNNYSKFEVHGTYLKVLGETGIIGTISYFVFLLYFSGLLLKGIVNNKKTLNNFFKCLFPFMVANLISWSYNHHLRKKEFWILYAVIYIVYINTKTKNTLNLNETKTH